MKQELEDVQVVETVQMARKPIVQIERDFEFIEKLKVKLGLKSENGA